MDSGRSTWRGPRLRAALAKSNDFLADAVGSVFAHHCRMHYRAIVAAGSVFLALVGCAPPADDSESENTTTRDGTTRASEETRAKLAVDRWQVREDNIDGMDVVLIQGEDMQGRTQAMVAVRWSLDEEAGERHVDVRVDDRVARLTQTRDGAFAWRGVVGLRESSRARTIAERVALDLESGAGRVSGQNVRPLSGGLVAGGPVDLVTKNPSWVDDVSACMKSLLEIFPDGYVGVHAICIGQHGP